MAAAKERPSGRGCRSASIVRIPFVDVDTGVSRSWAPITDRDMADLTAHAQRRHRELREARPDWCETLIAPCLVQGAARHRVHRDRGIKDLDVCLFYALPAGKSKGFPFVRSVRHVDSKLVGHGRQSYTTADRSDPKQARHIARWEQFSGRRLDLLARAIPFDGDARSSIREWLVTGPPGSTPWHFARVPVVLLEATYPVLWEGPQVDEAGWETGVYGEN